MVVYALLDFFTYALCLPYSETSEGVSFSQLLEFVARSGRALFRLFDVSALLCSQLRVIFIWNGISVGGVVVVSRSYGRFKNNYHGDLPRLFITSRVMCVYRGFPYPHSFLTL